MSFERAKAALVGTRFADLRWVPTTGSTNADMLGLLREQGAGTPTGQARPARPIVLVADHQSAGRGRLDRTWEAPAGASILMTIGMSVDDVAPERRTLLTAALAASVADAQPELRIKWPNDLVAVGAGDDGGDRKVGGILAEVHAVGGLGDCVLLGMGLNVNWPEIPADLAGIATSLNLVLGGDVDRDVLLADLLITLDTRWLPLVGPAAPSVEEFVAAYRARSATLGRRVRVELADAVLVGTAVDIEDDGALVVEDDQRVRRTVTVGDVVHLRPTD